MLSALFFLINFYCRNAWKSSISSIVYSTCSVTWKSFIKSQIEKRANMEFLLMFQCMKSGKWKDYESRWNYYNKIKEIYYFTMKPGFMWKVKKCKDQKSLVIRRHDYPKIQEYIFHLGKHVSLANRMLEECIWTI